MLKRRQFIQQLGFPLIASGTFSVPLVSLAKPVGSEEVTGISKGSGLATALDPMALAPIRADVNRLTGIYACTRAFRRAGPRIELEKLGRKNIVHNYGHGGSGWSLSWGSSTLAVRLAQTTGARSVGVIGCGALGLTSGLLALRAGLKVKIYTKALPPDVPSMNASGVWTPDSRICDAEHVAQLAARWEEMTRISYATYQKMLGLPGNPIEWYEGFSISDVPFGTRHASVADEPEYGDFSDYAPEIRHHSVELAPDSHPFAPNYVRRYTTMMFNISTYARMLMTDFLALGGQIEVAEFSHAGELLKLTEHTLINATGYGARVLFKDESVIPVRGQTQRLIPQTEVTYGLNTRTLSMVPRRDGLMVQVIGETGNFNNDDARPDRALAEEAIRQLAQVITT